MKDCKESVLSGFTPDKETIEKWEQHLENNGIVKGVECRLVGGQDEGKITTFGGVENCLINDLGISVGNGYFLMENKGELKVSKPLYRMTGEWERGLYGAIVYGKKKMVWIKPNYDAHIFHVDLIGGVAMTMTAGVDKGILYKFENESDLFEWLSKPL